MANGFFGTFTPRLDDKGRLTIPARYRAAFADGAMLVHGDSRCLYLFTVDAFDDFAQAAINAPVTNPEQIGRARYMLANSDFQTLDAQGRIMLTGKMREFAELDKDVVITGQGHRMEIWNSERWHAYEAVQEPGYIDPAASAAGAPGDRADT